MTRSPTNTKKKLLNEALERYTDKIYPSQRALKERLESGDIDFTADQQQYLQGYLPIVLLYLEVNNLNTAGGGLPILTGPGFVTTANVGEVKALVDAGTR